MKMSLMRLIKDKEFKELFSSEFLSVCIGLISGSLIGIFRNNIAIIPGLFILLPGLMELRGSIYSIISSRITSAIALGDIKIKNRKLIDRKLILVKNLVAAVFLSLAISSLLGLISFFLVLLLSKTKNYMIIYLAILSSFISTIILVILIYLLILYLIKKDLDIDIVFGPIFTSLGDIVCVTSIILSVIILT